MGIGVYYILYLAALVVLVVLMWPRKAGPLEGTWVCNPDGNPLCTQSPNPVPGGYMTEQDCLANCPYTPPNLFWTCDPKQGFCVTTPSPTPYPYSDERACNEACAPPGDWYTCENVQGKPGLHTGKCVASDSQEQDRFQCHLAAGKTCTPSDCNQDTCQAKQCWECAGPQGSQSCVPVDCEGCQAPNCWITDPMDPSTWSAYDTCSTQCGATPPPPPPPPPGSAFRWDPTLKQCTAQDPHGLPVVSGACVAGTCTKYALGQFYDTLANCLCCECPQNNTKYCQGASVCGPPGLLNAICCAGGAYCDPSVCQDCIAGRCLNKCNHDQNGNLIPSNCYNCYNSQCSLTPCLNAQGTCVPNSPSVAPSACTSPPAPDCHCSKVDCNNICSPVGNCLVYNDGLQPSDDSRWYCESGGWCLSPSDPTTTWTKVGFGQETPGVCFDGSPCQQKSGASPLPVGVQGCWPGFDTFVKDLPPA